MPKASSKRQEKRFTYGDYLTWPADERWEIIDGEAFCMSPAPDTIHQGISGDLFGILWQFFKGKDCKVFHAPMDVRLPTRKEADKKIETVVQPDLLIVCDESKIDDKGIRGAPDLVVEILSPSTASRDHIKKRAIYERHGVKEYWLIDPSSRMVFVYRRSTESGFAPAMILDGESLELDVPLFPGLTVRFDEVFPPKPKVVRESPAQYLVR